MTLSTPLKLLIVEDQPAIRKDIQAMLSLNAFAAIAKRIESRLKLTDHRMTIARVAIVLVNSQNKEIKKIKVGKSYQFIAGEEKAKH